jgi:hypothetical protein
LLKYSSTTALSPNIVSKAFQLYTITEQLNNKSTTNIPAAKSTCYKTDLSQIKLNITNS